MPDSPEIATPDIAIARPGLWPEEPMPTTPVCGVPQEGLSLLDTPVSLIKPQLDRLPDFGAENVILSRLLIRLRDQLAEFRVGDASIVYDLAELGATRIRLLDQTLGEGEVSGVVAGACEYQVQETVLPGVWRVRTAEPGTGRIVAEHLEIAEIPDVVQAAAAAMRTDLPMPAEVPADLMNGPALITEILHRMKTHPVDAPNHVFSFTLLPVSPDDMAFMKATLGLGPVELFSRGYGHARITATGARRVWSVQYLNAMGTPILDTIEVGGIPASVRAATEDFEDSAERLGEILSAYFE